MEKIKITFLGTSQAIPTATRNHTAILLSYKDENILVDCGEGTQRQFRKAKINPCKITKLLITHWHGDHVLGIPGLFQTLALNNYKRTLKIYGPKGTVRYINEILNIFIQKNKIKTEITEKNSKLFENKDFTLEAVPLDHDIPTNGYMFLEKDKLKIKKDKLKSLNLKKEHFPLIKNLTEGKDIKINNKLIKSKDLTYSEKGKKISFVLDTKFCDRAIVLSKNSDLVIAESTYAKNEEALAKEHKHLTTEQAAKIAKSAKAKQLILTHLSQRYEFKENILLNEAKKIFNNTSIAKDLAVYEI